jgi:GNAT superfamily N-acetyltransferase
MPIPRIALSDEQIARCFDVMSELRPHLQREVFVDLVRQMETQAYRLAYLEHEGRVVAVAGYRITTNLHLGRHLFLDDLVVAADARSRGHGTTFIHWLREQALAAGCHFLDLVSGTQRGGAHRFYFAHGFTIASYHFSAELGTD